MISPGSAAFEIHGNPQAALELRLAWNSFVHVDQRLVLIQSLNRAIAGARAALHKSQLAEPHARANGHGKGARNDFGVQLAFVSLGHAVELGAVVGDEAGENVEAAGGALGVGASRNVVRQTQFLDERNDVNAVFFENGRAGQIDARHAQFLDFVGDGGVWSGQKAGSHSVGHVSQSQVKTRGLNMLGVDGGCGADVSARDQVADFLRGKDSRGPRLSVFGRQLRFILRKRSDLGSTWTSSGFPFGRVKNTAVIFPCEDCLRAGWRVI